MRKPGFLKTVFYGLYGEKLLYSKKVAYNMEDNKKSIERLLASGNVLKIKPEGYSMYPVLVPGRDEAFIKVIQPGSARRGNVLLYRRKSGLLVLHRLHHKGKDGLYMVGDNQVKTEGPVNENQVIGVLVAFTRNGKYISTDNILYKAVSLTWLFMRPVRRPFQLAAAWLKKACQQQYARLKINNIII